MRKKNPTKIVFIIFFVMGLLFFIGGLFLFSMLYIKESDRRYVNATIVDIESYRDDDGDLRHVVTVDYYVEGNRYENSLGYYNANMRVGDEVEIYYSIKDPKLTGVEGREYVNLILPGFGVIFLLVGSVGLIKDIINKNKRKKLIESGMQIYAQFDGVGTNISVAVNGVNPYVILCKWLNPRDNKEYLFKSDDIWFDPSDIIRSRNITIFKVYINLDKPSEYVVDISMIENLVVDLT